MIAALYVETDGCYFGLDGVDAWDEARDARSYAGPHPIVAHPPCERWGRFWHGSPRKPHQFKLGDDNGCFAAALAAVQRWGGIIEHPADSRAWGPAPGFSLPIPTRGAGWTTPDLFRGGRSCYVEQGHYGHTARKPTWLYGFGIDFPDLTWMLGAQRIPQWMLDRYGYKRARRYGNVSMVGGKDKKKIRNASPPEFRDLLLMIAATAR